MLRTERTIESSCRKISLTETGLPSPRSSPSLPASRSAVTARWIPVAAPAFVGREEEYVLECLRSTWISSTGEFIGHFEEAFADFCGTGDAISCVNGTAALHLALLALGAGPGDEVICPTFTYVACANAIAYCGATPVFVDAERETWNLDPSQLEDVVSDRTKGIVAVHVYGHPTDMDPVLEFARARGLFVVEDAAEAHGALYRGRKVGSLGHVGVFSFYGNKLITTGEGGMLVTDDRELASRIRQLRGQGQDPGRRYWFPMIGFNYRMTNIAAAIGLAQLENVAWHLARRRENAEWYRQLLGGRDDVELAPEAAWARSAFWMNSAVIRNASTSARDEVIRRMAEAGVETRPFFYPMHVLPPYRNGARRDFPVADTLSASGLNLPSGATLTRADAEHVSAALVDAVSCM